MLPRRPKYVPPNRETELAEMLETAVQGGVLLLEGPCGAGKTSLALECAHRLPAARWVSCWPRRERLEDPEKMPLFVDHIECLDKAGDWLAWCAQQVYGVGVVAISDRLIRLPPGARVQRLRVDERAQAQVLPEECQILSLPMPRQVLTGCHWLAELEDRFLVREQSGWLSLHPDLAGAPGPELRRRALTLLEPVEPGPLRTEVVFLHLSGLAEWERAVEHFTRQQPSLQQQGEFERIVRMTGCLLSQDPRLALAHFAQAEARAGQGRLEQALADLDNVLHWGDPALRLRALAARCHLRLDLGKVEGAERDARAAIEMAESLGGRQPARVKACNGLARVCNLRGQSGLGEEWSRQALGLAQNWQDPKGEAYSYFILGQCLGEQERWQESLSCCQSGLQLARQQGEIRLTLIARYWMAAALLQMERLDWAEQVVNESYVEARQFGDLKMLALGELMMAQLRLSQGQGEGAHGHLEAAEQLVRRCGYPLLAVRGLLLKQALHDQPEWGERARRLAEQVGLALPGSRSQEVWSSGQCRRLGQEAVLALRSERELYDVWIDLEQTLVWRRGRGSVPLMTKKIPMRLLLCLLRQPGQAHSAESLFRAGWDHEFEGESSTAQVRKNIASLRNLLGADAILAREHSYARNGGYYFNERLSYCVISEPAE
ncbi:MAG: winged helix-turn-helix domain-containing protein [Vulcanimicrobiota bacterium]